MTMEKKEEKPKEETFLLALNETIHQFYSIFISFSTDIMKYDTRKAHPFPSGIRIQYIQHTHTFTSHAVPLNGTYWDIYHITFTNDWWIIIINTTRDRKEKLRQKRKNWDKWQYERKIRLCCFFLLFSCSVYSGLFRLPVSASVLWCRRFRFKCFDRQMLGVKRVCRRGNASESKQGGKTAGGSSVNGILLFHGERVTSIFLRMCNLFQSIEKACQFQCARSCIVCVCQKR